ncbi:MAG: hypothetical protein V1913_16505 [Fibrobacterota bacterium]
MPKRSGIRRVLLVILLLVLLLALLLKRTGRDLVKAGEKRISRTVEELLREKLPRELTFKTARLNDTSLLLDSVSYAGLCHASGVMLTADWSRLLSGKRLEAFDCDLMDFEWSTVRFQNITLAAVLQDSIAIRFTAACPCTGAIHNATFIFDTLAFRLKGGPGRFSGDGGFQARAYKGRVTGKGEARSSKKGVRYNFDVTLKEVDINALPQKPEGISFEGRYNGKLSFSGDTTLPALPFRPSPRTR